MNCQSTFPMIKYFDFWKRASERESLIKAFSLLIRKWHLTVSECKSNRYSVSECQSFGSSWNGLMFRGFSFRFRCSHSVRIAFSCTCCSHDRAIRRNQSSVITVSNFMYISCRSFLVDLLICHSSNALNILCRNNHECARINLKLVRF